MFLAFGFGGSWLLGGALHLHRPDRISFLFAGGQKSIALGAPLATGFVRVSAVHYNTLQEADSLIEALERVL